MKNLRYQTISILAGAMAIALPVMAGPTYEFGAPGKAVEVSRTVDINMLDNYYEPNAISVRPGETVRFIVTNSGEFEHEFSLDTPAAHKVHRKQMAQTHDDRAEMDHSHMNSGDAMAGPMQHDDPNTLLLQPGESKDLVWKFTKAMLIEFACNVPGHYEAGMQGRIDFSK